MCILTKERTFTNLLIMRRCPFAGGIIGSKSAKSGLINYTVCTLAQCMAFTVLSPKSLVFLLGFP